MTAPLQVMMLGEVYAKVGRQVLLRDLPRLRQSHRIDLVIANGESAAGGHGLTVETARDLLRAGVDVITSGNRIFDQKEMIAFLGTPDSNGRVDSALPVLAEHILRPLNYPPGAPGRGWLTIQTPKGRVTVINLHGRVYVENLDNAFHAIDRLLDAGTVADMMIVDFHAEASSEKVVMGRYLDGRVAAVLGTGNRVATADARILPHGTAHVSDVGLVGPADGVGGLAIELALKPFISHMTTRAHSSRTGIAITFNSVVLALDPDTGRALSIERLDGQREPGGVLAL